SGSIKCSKMGSREARWAERLFKSTLILQEILEEKLRARIASLNTKVSFSTRRSSEFQTGAGDRSSFREQSKQQRTRRAVQHGHYSRCLTATRDQPAVRPRRQRLDLLLRYGLISKPAPSLPQSR